MSTKPHEIASYAFRTSHTEDGWINPFAQAVAEATAEEAAWKPGPDVASISDLSEHAANYLENLASKLRGRPAKDHQEWPTVECTPERWASLQTRVRQATDEVVSALTGPVNEEQVENAVDIAVHGAYHAGQIVKLRQLYAAQVKQTAKV